MKKKYFSYFSCLIVFSFAIGVMESCKTDTSGSQPAPSLIVGEMDATISGVSFKSVNGATKAGVNNTIVLKASIPLQSNLARDSISLSMIIPTSSTPPYSIDVTTDVSALINYCIVSYPSGNCISYQAKKGVGSGTINITSLSTNIEGTFSATLPAVSGTGSVTITGGAFKALLP